MANKNNEFQVKDNPHNRIKKTIAVLSGKGGVGKSLVTSLLATYLKRTGRYEVGVLDADLTGPSIPKLFGVDEARPQGGEDGIYPVSTHSDIKVMSVNLLLEDPSAPVVWRGPILAGTVKQFWSDVIWGDLDFLLIDMPPGTGDIPLTVFQSLPLAGIIIVTSPQDLVALIVQKAIQMARMMNIPILGLIENMSYMVCPHCQETIKLFGDGKTEAVARAENIPFLGSLPIDPELASLCDKGQIERIHKQYLNEALSALTLLVEPDGQINPVAEAKEPAGQRLVAIAADDGQIAQHFGHCQGFELVTLAGRTVVKRTFIENPGHKPGFLPVFLHDKGVETIVAQGMGASASDLFVENGIEVITGVSGSVDLAIESLVRGELKSSGEVCRDHLE